MGNKLTRTLYFSLFLFFLSGLYFPPSGISKPLAKTLAGDKQITSLFKSFYCASKSGSVEDARESLQAIVSWELDKGYQNAPFLSEALLKVYEGSPLYAKSSRQQRLAVYETIARVSPDEPHYRWEYFKNYFYAHPFDLYNHFRNIQKISRAIKTNLIWTIEKSGELFLAFIAALALTAFAMALNFIIKYAFHLVFYLKQVVRVPVHTMFAVLLLIVIFFLPIYFGIGFLWLPFFAMVLLWMILTKREKGVVLFLVVSFVCVNFGLRHIGRLYMAGANRHTFLLYQANYGQIEVTGYERLRKVAETSHTDSDVLFTLGLIAKRRGNYKEAAVYYQRALKAEPNFAECMNNLGNVYLLMKRSGENTVQKARTWYKKAIEVNSNRAEFYYNLSKSFPLLEVKGMEYVVKARDLNPGLIDRLTRRDSPHPNQMLVDCLLSNERLYHRAFSPGEVSKSMSTLFWKFFLNSPMQNPYVMPVVLILLIILFSVLQKNVGSASSCSHCGQLFFRRIPMRFNKRLCQQCYVILHRANEGNPDLVRQKGIDKSRYRRRKKITTILMGGVPFGGGFIIDDRPIIGMFVSFFFFGFLSYFLICRELFPALAMVFFGYAGCSYFFLVVAILVYLLNLTRMVHKFREGF